MFGPSKNALIGERFGDDTAVEDFVHNCLRILSSSLCNGSKKLPVPWEKYVLKTGDYIEK